MKHRPVNYSKILDFTSRYALVTLLSIVVLAFVRVVEFLLFQFVLKVNPNPLFLLKYSIAYDALFALLVSCILLIPIAVVAFWKQQLAIKIYWWCWGVLLLIYLMLTHFFIASQYLLTAIVFDYSLSEILYIIGSDVARGGNVAWWLYLSIPLAIVFCNVAYKLLSSKYTRYISLSLWLVGVVLLVQFSRKGLVKSPYSFKRQFDYYISNNKVLFLGNSILLRFNNVDSSIDEAIEVYQKCKPSFNFNSSRYPLMHDEPYCNVLGDYFPQGGTPPNIVIIMAEGIGNYYAGLNDGSEHILPFVDSLARNGLYWENFLSNCCRTYSFLPNTLASLPSGTLERGFMSFNGNDLFGKFYPDHNSIFKELKKNGFHTSFVYGGWGFFDYMELFMKDQPLDLFVDETKFDTLKYISPKRGDPSTFFWGYDDHALFNQWHDFMRDSIHANQPFISVILTLNNHEPHNIAPKKYYDEDFLDQRARRAGINQQVRKGFSTSILASVFAFEDALKEFFEIYKRRSDYKNTIFIVVGDHYSYHTKLGNPLGIYHVPFIIYSPLLKRSAVFRGVSTHLDITPSLIALLQDNFGMTFSKGKHWIGEGLDTCASFRSTRIAHLNTYSSDYPNFLYKNYLLSNGSVFRIGEGFDIVPVVATDTVEMVTGAFQSYKTLDSYVCKNNRLWHGY